MFYIGHLENLVCPEMMTRKLIW